MSGWTIYPVYRGCRTIREYVAVWNGTTRVRFDRKADAEAHVAAHPNGPQKARRLRYVNGKRVWDEAME